MPLWFAPRASAASKGSSDASSATSSSPSTLNARPVTISAQEWEEASGKSSSSGEQKRASVSTATQPSTVRPSRLAPPCRSVGAEILFSAASTGDVDAVRRSLNGFEREKRGRRFEKGL